MIMDGCCLVSRLNGNKLDDTIDSEFSTFIEGGAVNPEEMVDDDLEVLRKIMLG